MIINKITHLSTSVNLPATCTSFVYIYTVDFYI
jgi:hypothetical protein